MSERVVFKSVHPIGDTDTDNLPVKDVASAIGYYTKVLGFDVESRSDGRAVLRRDEACIGLAVNGSDPDNASCYFEVSDVDALRAELDAMGIEPSPIREDQGEGESYRIFFCKEPYGVCFCFGHTI